MRFLSLSGRYFCNGRPLLDLIYVHVTFLGSRGQQGQMQLWNIPPNKENNFQEGLLCKWSGLFLLAKRTVCRDDFLAKRGVLGLQGQNTLPTFTKASLTRFWKLFSSLATWSLENTLRFPLFIFLEIEEENWMRGTYDHGQREKRGQKCRWRCSFFAILPDRMFLMEKGRSDIFSLLGRVSSVQSMVGNWKVGSFLPVREAKIFVVIPASSEKPVIDISFMPVSTSCNCKTTSFQWSMENEFKKQ